MRFQSFVAAALCFAVVPAIAQTTASAQDSNTAGTRSMWMTVGERRVSVTLADNEAARAFAALLPLTVEMPDLNANEKHVKLPKPLPANAHRPGTIRNGDLMLWGADTLVVFYLTFDSPYSYTRLGRIDDPESLPQVLGRGQVRIAFTKK